MFKVEIQQQSGPRCNINTPYGACELCLFGLAAVPFVKAMASSQCALGGPYCDNGLHSYDIIPGLSRSVQDSLNSSTKVQSTKYSKLLDKYARLFAAILSPGRRQLCLRSRVCTAFLKTKLKLWPGYAADDTSISLSILCKLA